MTKLPIALLALGASTLAAAMLPAGRTPPALTLAWPIPLARDANVQPGYFPDQDPGTGAVDHLGSPCAYDGHEGTDLNLDTFAEMDSGFAVIAAADGVVRQAVDSFPDRNGRWIDSNWNRANFVVVSRPDGSSVEYFHLRRRSAVPRPGDSIRVGDTLGMVGSSGYSDWPHLHLGVRTRDGLAVDPWAGPRNPHPGSWTAQRAHPLDQPPRIVTARVLKLGLPGVGLSTLRADSLKYGLPSPLVFAARSESLAVWVRYRARSTDTLRWSLTNPSGRTVWNAADPVGSDRCNFLSYRWLVVPGGLGIRGTWTFRVRLGQDSAIAPFQVGDADRLAPTFARAAGVSLKVQESAVAETLGVRGCTGCRLALTGAPAGVRLRDSVLEVAPRQGRPRQSFFGVEALDEQGSRSVFRVHLVDLSAPWRAAPASARRNPTRTSGKDDPRFLPQGSRAEDHSVPVPRMGVGGTRTPSP